jgi:hypothetical protein
MCSAKAFWACARSASGHGNRSHTQPPTFCNGISMPTAGAHHIARHPELPCSRIECKGLVQWMSCCSQIQAYPVQSTPQHGCQPLHNQDLHFTYHPGLAWRRGFCMPVCRMRNGVWHSSTASILVGTLKVLLGTAQPSPIMRQYRRYLKACVLLHYLGLPSISTEGASERV